MEGGLKAVATATADPGHCEPLLNGRKVGKDSSQEKPMSWNSDQGARMDGFLATWTLASSNSDRDGCRLPFPGDRTTLEFDNDGSGRATRQKGKENEFNHPRRVIAYPVGRRLPARSRTRSCCIPGLLPSYPDPDSGRSAAWSSF